MAGVSIFKHLWARRIISHVFSICDSSSPCLSIYKYYFRYCSHIYNFTNALFDEKYQVINHMSNPLSALFARISYVQVHEPRLSEL